MKKHPVEFLLLKCCFLILTVFLLYPFSDMLIQGEEDEQTPKIVLIDEKFSISKLTHPNSPKLQRVSDDIILANVGGKDATFNYVISEIKLQSANPLSGAPKVIPQNNIQFDMEKTIPAGKTNHMGNLSVLIDSDITASYGGKIYFYGDGFEPFTTDIEIKITHDQPLILTWTLLGIFSGCLFGILEYKASKNSTKPSVQTKCLEFLFHGKANHPKGDELKLYDILKTFFIPRVILISLALFISIPGTLFTNTFFFGIPFLDAITAIAFGFLAYRAKDITKIMRKES